MKLFSKKETDAPKQVKNNTEKMNTGDTGEAAAREYLENLGYKLKERNFRHSHSEIDLIMKDGDTYVFCEVRTQNTENLNYKTPSESISENKKAVLCLGANYYMAKLNRHDIPPCRFDVVEVFLEKGNVKEINHIKNAFYMTRKTTKGTRYKSCRH